VRGALIRYRSWSTDSARWEGFAFRKGDIIISAPIKCGTTWAQMICALLIFQRRALPTTLDRVSPWLDMLTRPLADVVGDLNAQRHRRFIKSHTPLDGLPFDERVTYICVGRDPRDVALSFDNHMANMDMNACVAALRTAAAQGNEVAVSPERPPPRSGSERERFWHWVNDARGLRAMVHHLATFWNVRERPNVILLHYGDLDAELEGQIRRLAARLRVDVPENLWPGVVKAATFEEMRRRADEIVPNVTETMWHDNGRFFNKGTCGQWKRLLDAEDLRLYQARIKGLAPSDLAAWMHYGSIVGRSQPQAKSGM
jgi:aryl sulfotransferase